MTDTYFEEKDQSSSFKLIDSFINNISTLIDSFVPKLFEGIYTTLKNNLSNETKKIEEMYNSKIINQNNSLLEVSTIIIDHQSKDRNTDLSEQSNKILEFDSENKISNENEYNIIKNKNFKKNDVKKILESLNQNQNDHNNNFEFQNIEKNCESFQDKASGYIEGQIENVSTSKIKTPKSSESSTNNDTHDNTKDNRNPSSLQYVSNIHVSKSLIKKPVSEHEENLNKSNKKFEEKKNEKSLIKKSNEELDKTQTNSSNSKKIKKKSIDEENKEPEKKSTKSKKKSQPEETINSNINKPTINFEKNTNSIRSDLNEKIENFKRQTDKYNLNVKEDEIKYIFETVLENRNINLVCKYRQSQKNKFKASTFHDKCDQIGESLVICRSEDDRIFGGVNFINWDKSNIESIEKKNFLFSLKPKMNIFKLKDGISSKKSMKYREKKGPIFGENDLVIGNNCLKEKTCSSNLGKSFEFSGNPDKSYKIFSKKDEKFSLKAIMIFSIEEFDKNI